MYISRWSSCGESGAGRGNCAGDGICRDRPRERKSGLREALGVVGGTALSSLLPWRSRSRKVGEGCRGLGADAGSEKERFLAGDLEGVAKSWGATASSVVPSIILGTGRMRLDVSRSQLPGSRWTLLLMLRYLYSHTVEIRPAAVHMIAFMTRSDRAKCVSSGSCVV